MNKTHTVVMVSRPTHFEIRRSLYRGFDPADSERLAVSSVPFETHSISRSFIAAVSVKVYPDIQRTAGTKYASVKLTHVVQLLAAARLAGLHQKTVALQRKQQNLLTTMADHLVWHGFLGQAKGNRRSKRVTRYWLTEKAEKVLAPFVGWRDILEPLQERPVLLRDSDGHDRKLPNDTPGWVKIHGAQIRKFNRHNLNLFDWEYVDDASVGQKLMPCVRQIFKTDFAHGGRMYSWGSDGYQGLCKSVRRSITVDREPTMELDFGGYYPRMLYHWRGCVDFHGDIYQPDLIFAAACGLGPELKAAARTLAKKSLNIALNARSEAAARQSIHKIIGGWAKRDGQWTRSRRKARPYRHVLQLCGHDAGSIIEQLRVIHQPIAHCFFTGIGLELMVTDGWLMLLILKDLMQRNLPALGIHDSVLCRVRDIVTVEQVMRKWYHTFFGFQPEIRL